MLLLHCAGTNLSSVSCSGLQPSIFSLLLLQSHAHSLHTKSNYSSQCHTSAVHFRASLALAYTTQRTMAAFQLQSPVLVGDRSLALSQANIILFLSHSGISHSGISHLLSETCGCADV